MLSYVTLILDLYDGQGNPVITGSAAFTPSAVLTDAGAEVIGQNPVPAVFHAGGLPQVKLLATDSSGPVPTGWTWGVTFSGQTVPPAGFSFFLTADSMTFTATDASPCIFTGSGTAYVNGTGVQLSGGSLPAGFSSGTTYYVVSASGSTFKLAATAGGSPLGSTSTGSGSVIAVQQFLSNLIPVSSGTSFQGYMPLPSGTPSPGQFPVATGTGTASAWGGGVIIIPSGDSSGVTDTANLQAALTAARTAGFGGVKGQPGGTYYTDGYLVIGSGTTLDMTDCTIRLVNTTAGAMLRNYSAVNPAATAADAAVSSGSGVITTSLGASAVAGQSVVVAGAGGAGGAAAPLTGLVSAQTATTITVTNLDGSALTAGITVTSASVQLYNRDSLITAKGGYWNAGSIGPTSQSTANHKIYLCHADYFWLDIQQVYCTGQGFCVYASDVTHGHMAHRDAATATAGADGLHIDGPAWNMTVEEVSGSTGDDLLSIVCSNWPGSSYTAGNIIGVRVGVVSGTSAIRSLNLIAGAGYLLDDVKVTGVITGTSEYISIGDDTTEPQTTGGTYGLIDLGRVRVITSSYYMIFLSSPSMGEFRVDLDYGPTSPSASTAAVEVGGTSTVTIGKIILTGYVSTNSSNANRRVLEHDVSNVTVAHLVMNGIELDGGTATGSALLYLGGGVVTQADLFSCRLNMSSTSDSSMVLVNSSGSVLSYLNLFSGTSYGYAAVNTGSSSPTTITAAGGFACTGATRMFSLFGSGKVTIMLAGCTAAVGSAIVFYTNACPVLIKGDQMIIAGSPTVLSRQNGNESVEVIGLQLPMDLSQLIRTGGGDMASNSNGSLSCGTGPCISSGSGSSGSWKNLFSGSTY